MQYELHFKTSTSEHFTLSHELVNSYLKIYDNWFNWVSQDNYFDLLVSGEMWGDDVYSEFYLTELHLSLTKSKPMTIIQYCSTWISILENCTLAASELAGKT